MKHKAPHFLSVLMVLSFAQIVIPQCDAHVLVYRVKLMSGTKEDAGGIRQESWPSSLSTLSIIDLDTDFVETTDGTEKRGIRLDEKRGVRKIMCANRFGCSCLGVRVFTSQCRINQPSP